MWSGVEPDVPLFASGRMLDDGGEWSGGQPLSDGGTPSPGTTSREVIKKRDICCTPYSPHPLFLPCLC